MSTFHIMIIRKPEKPDTRPWGEIQKPLSFSNSGRSSVYPRARVSGLSGSAVRA